MNVFWSEWENKLKEHSELMTSECSFFASLHDNQINFKVKRIN